MIRRLLVLLLLAAGVPLVLGGTAVAATPTITLSGTVTTADGGPMTTPVIVTLYSWTPAGDAAYPTSQGAEHSVFIEPGPSKTSVSYTLTVPSAGYWAIRAAVYGSDAKYGSTWYGSGSRIAQDYDEDGVIYIPEGSGSQTGKDIVLPKAVTVTGTVRGAHGDPVSDATVSALQWSDHQPSQLETIGGVHGAISGPDGRFSLPVPPGVALSLSVSNRPGYADWVLGTSTTTKTAANTLDVGTNGATQDIELVPDWSQSTGASGAVVQDEYCLQHAGSGTAVLPHRSLDVSTYGVITRTDLDDLGWSSEDNPFTSDEIGPALVPLWMGVTRPTTWGVSGNRLCAIWRSTFQDGTVFQAIVDDTDDGADVTYNYGSVAASNYTGGSAAGWLNSDDSARFPDAPGRTDQLATLHTPSERPGRFTFHFDFIFRPPYKKIPTLTSPAVVGQSLTADPGTWTIPAGSTPTFRYVWKRDGEEIPTAGTSSYVPRRADVGHDISVMVTLLAGPAWDEGFDEDVPAERVAPATSSVRLTGPHRVRKGQRARVNVAVQMPGLVPEGSVTILDRGVPIATRTLGSDGRASVRLPRLPRGRHQLVASYSGDSTTQPATSTVVRLRVVRR